MLDSSVSANLGRANRAGVGPPHYSVSSHVLRSDSTLNFAIQWRVTGCARSAIAACKTDDPDVVYVRGGTGWWWFIKQRRIAVIIRSYL